MMAYKMTLPFLPEGENSGGIAHVRCRVAELVFFPCLGLPRRTIVSSDRRIWIMRIANIDIRMIEAGKCLSERVDRA